MTRRMKGASVLVIGPYPPPVHGAAVITAAIADRLAEQASVRRCDLSPGTLKRSPLYHFRRIWRAIAALAVIVDRAERGGTVYISAAGGFGLIYNSLHAIAARLRHQQIFIHHHSFAYLDHKSALMRMLVWSAGREAAHVVLCSRMAEILKAHYPGVGETYIVSNAAFAPPHQKRDGIPAGPLRIGHLSNLTAEKGLDLVLDLCQAARDIGLSMQLVLAGPPADEEAVGMIAAASALFPESCVYRGAVHGSEKDRFFADIDVFVFPTRYVNEAEPLVIFEAMARGVPVISFDRGCIAEQLSERSVPHEGGIVVPPGDSFIEHALTALSLWSAQPEILIGARDMAQGRAVHLHKIAIEQMENLLAALAGKVVP